MSKEAEKSEPTMSVSEAISLIESVFPSLYVQRKWSLGPQRMCQNLRRIVIDFKQRQRQLEYYYKGIYPVELIRAFRVAGNKNFEVRAKVRFLHTSNYSEEKHWIKPGEILRVPARLVWRRHRNSPKGH